MIKNRELHLISAVLHLSAGRLRGLPSLPLPPSIRRAPCDEFSRLEAQVPRRVHDGEPHHRLSRDFLSHQSVCPNLE